MKIVSLVLKYLPEHTRDVQLGVEAVPGASVARARAAPSIIASAPHAIALTMSPERPSPPSAITCTYRPPDSSR